MNNIGENPVADGAQAVWDATFTNGVTCLTCRTVLRGDAEKTAEQQLSASGAFCEECVLVNCDTAKRRKDYLVDRGLYVRFVNWAHKKYWMARLNTEGKSYDEFTHKDAMYLFMEQNEYDHPYFVWLMETN
jgi:hypothetical protein